MTIELFFTPSDFECKDIWFKSSKTVAVSRFTTACHTSLPSSSLPKMPASSSTFVEILESGEKAFSLIAATRCENFSPNSSELFFSFSIGFLSLLALPRTWSAIESISELGFTDPEIRDFLSKLSIVLLPINWFNFDFATIPFCGCSMFSPRMLLASEIANLSFSELDLLILITPLS